MYANLKAYFDLFVNCYFDIVLNLKLNVKVLIFVCNKTLLNFLTQNDAV